MAYDVRLSRRALTNLRNIYQAIRVVHSPVAEDWFLGLEATIFSLEHAPQRNPITPEQPNHSWPVALRFEHNIKRDNPPDFGAIVRPWGDTHAIVFPFCGVLGHVAALPSPLLC